jgi:pimeloyl-ACP methyl ester carboxylesterase
MDTIGEWAPLADGRELYVERAGTGTPVVLFEAGMGASRHSWGAVAPAVARHTSTVTYDRSGLGRSPADPEPRVLSRLVDDLVGLLRHLGDGPYVLVGHSWGGPIVRLVSAREPDLVGGLVLVDQTDEGCDLFFTKANRRQARLAGPVLPVAARLGLIRMAAGRLAAQLPEPAAAGMRAEDGTVAAVRAQRSEMERSLDDLAALRDAPVTLPDIPVTFISGVRPSRLEGRRRTAIVEAHRAGAAALPQGRHVEAAASSHYVPFTDAQLVVDEVLHVVDQLRKDP